MQEWEEIPNDELPNIELNAKCVRADEESWVYVIICMLHYLNMRQPGLPHMQGNLTPAQAAAIMKLYEKFSIIKNSVPNHSLESCIDTDKDIVRNHRRRYIWDYADLQSEPSESHVCHPTNNMIPGMLTHDPRVARKTKVVLLGRWPENDSWMDDASRIANDDDDATLSTFTRWRPRKTPPLNLAGLGNCSNSVVQRWKDDNYAYLPYQYDYNNLIISLNDGNTQVRDRKRE